MSYYWTPFCTSCSENGPKIRSGHSGLKFGPDHATSTELLKQWLDRHEYHDIWLRGEGVGSQDLDAWNPQGAAGVRLHTNGPGTRQIIGNSGDAPIRLRENEGTSPTNRFVFPPGVTEIIVPPHGTAMFVAEKPSRWYRLWCRLIGRAPTLRWRYEDPGSPSGTTSDPE